MRVWLWWRTRWVKLTSHGWVKERYMPFKGWVR